MASSVITTLAELNSMSRDWDALATTAASPLLDFDWFVSCAEALHDERDLRIVTTHDRGRLTGVAPLARESGGPGRHLVLLGTACLYEPSAWLYSSPAALAELTLAVLQMGTPLLLQRIPATSGMPDNLVAVMRGRGLTIVRTTSPSLGVATHGSWDDYRSRISRRTLSSLSKGLAHAEAALGPSCVEEIEPRPEDVGQLLEGFADLEGSGWKGRRGSSIGQRADLAAFFHGYCKRAAERGRLRVTRLSYGSRIAATEIAVDAYGRRWGLKIAYRDELAMYSPGLQVVHASVRAALERGLEAYEFLGIAEDWQRRWRPDERQYRLIAFYPWNISGLVGVCNDLGGAILRRISGGKSRASYSAD